MAIGRNSLVKTFVIPNNKDHNEHHVVLVQANKNHGICDILLVIESGRKRLAEVLSTFQGRQFDDVNTAEHLYGTLQEVLNPVEE